MLIYISSSNIDKKVANSIQSKYMGKSLKKHFKTLTIFQGNSNKETYSNIHLKKIGKGFLNNIIFSLRVLKIIKSKRNFSKLKNIIYSRTELVSILTYLIGYKTNILEVHDIRFGSFSFYILWFLKFTKIIVISINSKIKEDLINMGFNKERIFVLSDCHGNKTNSLEEGIKKYYELKNKKDKLKIGYFGKISPSKGSKILKELILKYGRNIEFNIYSINKNVFKKLSCKIKKVEHKYVFKEMLKMDILLYVTNLEKKNNHAKYTSPLKIYEYISTLRPILYMPAGDLKNELKNTIAIPFENIFDFSTSLEKILTLENPNILIENTYKVSNNKTWDKRAENLRSIIYKNFKLNNNIAYEI